jgi:hypothetical protein
MACFPVPPPAAGLAMILYFFIKTTLMVPFVRRVNALKRRLVHYTLTAVLAQTDTLTTAPALQTLLRQGFLKESQASSV